MKIKTNLGREVGEGLGRGERQVFIHLEAHSCTKRVDGAQLLHFMDRNRGLFLPVPERDSKSNEVMLSSIVIFFLPLLICIYFSH